MNFYGRSGIEEGREGGKMARRQRRLEVVNASVSQSRGGTDSAGGGCPGRVHSRGGDSSVEPCGGDD